MTVASNRILQTSYYMIINTEIQGFPGGSVVKNLPAKARDTGSIPGPGRSHIPRSNWGHVPQLLSMSSKVQEVQLLSPSTASPEARAL